MRGLSRAWIGRLCAALLLVVPALAQALPPVQRGYIEMSDGVGLRYSVQLPDGEGPFPVLLQYQGYGAGSSPNDNGMVLIAPRLLEKGFAILGVNLRGTGCSEGDFDLFEQQWVADGYAVIEWAARQSWSNGKVAMVGLSFPAIAQMMVAPSRPPSLVAAMPWSAITDLYRDVAYPGGIFNQSFAGAWTGIQKDGHQYIDDEMAAGNTRCPTAIAGQNRPDRIVFVEGQRNAWADHFFYTRLVPEGSLLDIDIPMLVTHAWQDEQLGSRVTVDYEQLLPEKTWMIYGNGAHGFGLGAKFVVDEAEAFLLHFVKGVDNGFERHPRVHILHETGYDGSHRWVTAHPRWPAPTRLAELYLTPAGTLEPQRPQESGAVDYVYPLPAPSMTSALAAQQENQTYQLPVPPGGAAVFTSAPLAHDLEILGTVRADLWLSSTAADTDVQVSLTEIRSDGRELFVQRGWLRASHRKMDLRPTRANRPYQTHLESDAVPLAAGEPTLLSVEVWAVGHVFRAGSALRVAIEAPLGNTGFRNLQIVQTPALNTVHVGAPYVSRITIPVVPGAKAPMDYPACGTLINQPCRDDPGTVPAGTMSVPSALHAAPTAGGAHAAGSGAFLLTNTSAESLYLRALTLRIDDTRQVSAVGIQAGSATVEIAEPAGRARFELPEIELRPGQRISVQAGYERRRQASATGSLANLAYAEGGAVEDAGGNGAILPIWTLLALAILVFRHNGLRAALIASALLVGCSSSQPLDDRSLAVGGETAGLHLTDVEAVNARGEFVGIEGMPLAL
ncbi:MAG: CocE/NonD family hydrolase [Gammaproteobacteria bacterium]|nr:CocE/NonD family hydrolase [Gammaproteobacteria bacterium]